METTGSQVVTNDSTVLCANFYTESELFKYARTSVQRVHFYWLIACHHELTVCLSVKSWILSSILIWFSEGLMTMDLHWSTHKTWELSVEAGSQLQPNVQFYVYSHDDVVYRYRSYTDLHATLASEDSDSAFL